MKTTILDKNGDEQEEVNIPEPIFNQKFNKKLVYQVVSTMQKKQRKPTAHAKTRKEVAGGGRKPWPQKGTGRARHGSIRSPLWKGGGVTFGPSKEKKSKQKINKKMKRKALLMTLSKKLQDEEIIFVDELKIKKPKTKKIKTIIDKILPKNNKSCLVLLPEKNENIIKSCNNLPFCDTQIAKDINPLQILNYKYLVIPKKSIEVIKNTFNK